MIKTNFKKDFEEKISFFERGCVFSERIIKVSPDKRTAQKLQDAIDFCDMKITPTQVMSFAIFSLLFGLAITTILLFIRVEILYVIILFIISFLGMLYILNYPFYLSQVLRVKASSELVLSVVYMVISMRTIPNLENAVKFVGELLSGPLARDFKKILWFMEIGKYYTVEEGLAWLVKKWKEENEEFVESINLLISSTQVGGERREAMLNEAIDLILNGTKERLTHYSQSLRTPVYILHAMGILLPLMGLVMFPIVAVFLGEVVRPVVLLIGYDIILPITLFWFTEHIMGKRPITFALPDIAGHPDVPPNGKFFLNTKKKRISLPAWPFAFIASLPFLVLGILYYGSSKDVFINTIYSLLFVWAITLGTSVYLILITFQSIGVREDIKKVEAELPEVLFQLGNQLSVGMPVEKAVENSLIHFKNMKMGDLFARTVENIKKFGLTFEYALFDKNVGSLQFYPSKLLALVMRTIVESVKKSTKTASEIIKIISNHLKSMHAVEEIIKDILGEVVASINFQSIFLAPLVAGITVTMAVVMIFILTTITGKVGGVEVILPFWKEIPITAEQFQLIVGIYMIESCIILAYSANKIEYGIDEVGRNYLIGKTLLIATIVYTFSLIVSILIFGPTIARLVM